MPRIETSYNGNNNDRRGQAKATPTTGLEIEREESSATHGSGYYRERVEKMNTVIIRYSV